MSTEPTAMAFSATAGALAEKRPELPALPWDAVTTTPASLSESAPRAVGYVGHVMYGTPIEMLTTSMPSLAARSMADRMMSVSVEPLQPKTRYAPRKASGATPVKPGSLPAAMPATWVPWPSQSSGTPSGTGVGLYRSDPTFAS